jgi:hypothetical protein
MWEMYIIKLGGYVVCERFSDFMKAQMDIIGQHIDEHAWCQHIEDKNKAVIDFIDKFGWVMRESYCHCCPEYNNGECAEYKEACKQ